MCRAEHTWHAREKREREDEERVEWMYTGAEMQHKLTHHGQFSQQLISLFISVWPLQQLGQIQLSLFELGADCRRVVEMVDPSTFECIGETEWC